MGDVPNFLCDCGGLDKEIIRSIGPAFARPGQVDDGVDRDIGDVHPFRPDLPCDRLGENTLRGLGGCESRKIRTAAMAPRMSANVLTGKNGLGLNVVIP